MKPIIFGAGNRQLYGVYHPAVGLKRRHSSVLLCYPHVTEYNFVHRAYRQIALMLSNEGFDVFRFDYYGTGDSGGDAGSVGLEHWVSDVAIAAEELRELSRISEVSIVGRQLGATIAIRAVAKGLSVKRIVLWEPIFSGVRFIDQLEHAHREACLARLQPVSDGSHPWNALLGFPFPPSLRSEIEQIQLFSELPVKTRVGLLFSALNDDRNGTLEVEKWVAANSPYAKRILLTNEPQFEPGSVREGIIAAGTVPSRLVDLLSEVWDCES
jgi:pimeloyl-ACP methyl ester carboxylesterase